MFISANRVYHFIYTYSNNINNNRLYYMHLCVSRSWLQLMFSWFVLSELYIHISRYRAIYREVFILGGIRDYILERHKNSVTNLFDLNFDIIFMYVFHLDIYFISIGVGFFKTMIHNVFFEWINKYKAGNTQHITLVFNQKDFSIFIIRNNNTESLNLI